METFTFLNNLGGAVFSRLSKNARLSEKQGVPAGYPKTRLIKRLVAGDFTARNESARQTERNYRRVIDHMIATGWLNVEKKGRTQHITLSAKALDSDGYESRENKKTNGPSAKAVRIMRRNDQKESMERAVKEMAKIMRKVRKNNKTTNEAGNKEIKTMKETVNATTVNATKTITMTVTVSPEKKMEIIKDMIDRVSGNGQFCGIQYMKKDGEVVKRSIRQGVVKHLKTDFTSEAERIAHKVKQAEIKANNPHLIQVWDKTAETKGRKEAAKRGVEFEGKQAYRSYDVNNILSIKGGGQTITLDNRVEAGIPHLQLTIFDTLVGWYLCRDNKVESGTVSVVTSARKRKHSTSVKQTIERLLETIKENKNIDLVETGYTLDKNTENVTATHTNGNKTIEKTGVISVSESKGCSRKKTCDSFGNCFDCDFRKAERQAEK